MSAMESLKAGRSDMGEFILIIVILLRVFAIGCAIGKR